MVVVLNQATKGSFWNSNKQHDARIPINKLLQTLFSTALAEALKENTNCLSPHKSVTMSATRCNILRKEVIQSPSLHNYICQTGPASALVLVIITCMATRTADELLGLEPSSDVAS